MSKVFNLKAGDSVRFWNRNRWWKIEKVELRPEEVGVARTIRLYFEGGGAGSYCSDGEVSGSTHERYFHDIAEIQTKEQTDD